MAPIAPKIESSQSLSLWASFAEALNQSVATTKPPPQYVTPGEPSLEALTGPLNLPHSHALFGLTGQAQKHPVNIPLLSDKEPATTINQINSIKVAELLDMDPDQVQKIAQEYHEARLAENMKHLIALFPKNTVIKLNEAIGMFPSVIQDALAPLASDRDVTIELIRDSDESTNLQDAMLGATAFATYRFVIRHKGLVVNAVKQAPVLAKNGTIRFATDPGIPMAGIKVMGFGVVYICLDRYLAKQGVPEYARGPAILGLHLGGQLGVDAIELAAFGKPMPWKSYGQALNTLPAYYLTYKGASFLINEAGLDYNNPFNMLGSLAVSYGTTKPMIKGLGWAVQTTISGMSRIGARVSLASASLGATYAGRSLGVRLIPAAVALVGKAIGSGFLAGAAKFIGKAKNVVNPVAWGLLALDIVYAVKDGTSEGADREMQFARDSYLAEAHWGVTNFFLGSVFKVTVSDDDVLKRHEEIKAELQDYVADFNETLWKATLDFAKNTDNEYKFPDTNNISYKDKLALHLKEVMTQKQSTDDVAGLREALEVFVSLGAARHEVLDYISTDGTFDGAKMANAMLNEVDKKSSIAHSEYVQNLQKHNLVTLNERGEMVSVSHLTLGELTSEARAYLLGSNGNRLSPFVMLNLQVSTLNAMQQKLTGLAVAAR